MGYCPHCGKEVGFRDLQAKDNTFREEPDDAQASLDDIEADEEPEPSDDPGVWDRADLDEDSMRDLGVTEPDLRFGEVMNENDPSEW